MYLDNKTGCARGNINMWHICVRRRPYGAPLSDLLVAVANLIDPLVRDRRKVRPITFQVLIRLSKHFLRAPFQKVWWDTSKRFRESFQLPCQVRFLHPAGELLCCVFNRVFIKFLTVLQILIACKSARVVTSLLCPLAVPRRSVILVNLWDNVPAGCHLSADTHRQREIWVECRASRGHLCSPLQSTAPGPSI